MPRMLSPSGRFVNPCSAAAVTAGALQQAGSGGGLEGSSFIQGDTAAGSLQAAGQAGADQA